MKNLRHHVFSFVLILVIGLFITRYIWGTRAWIETHDGIFHVVRTVQMTKMLQLGQFPVRWAGDLDNGFGIPLFNYVYPGPYLATIPLMLAGFGAKWSVKLITLGLYILGALGIYVLFKAKSRTRAIALAVLYMTTPYVLVNIFVRGALGETMAMALMPWVLVSLQDINRTGQLRWYHPLPYALLFIAHNFLSFVFIPIYAGMTYVSKVKWTVSLKNIIVALGLSAFFVIPMLGERGYISSFAHNNFTYPYSDHFVYPSQLVYSKWGNGPSVAGTGDGMSFQLGFVHIVVGIIAGFLIVRQRNQRLRIVLVLLAAVIFLMLPYSQMIWKIITPIQAMQFPWRLLSFSSLLIVYMVGSVWSLDKTWVLFLVIASGISLVFACVYSTPPYLQNNEQFATQLFLYGEKTTTSSRLELLPRWAEGPERWVGQEPVIIAQGQAQFTVSDQDPSGLTITSQSEGGVQYHVRRNYYPSWYVQDENSRSVKISPSPDGEILFDAAPGSHVFRVKIGQTMMEKIANTISLFTIVYVIATRKRTL